jgi:predicted AlkP superfamily phosphohydrolase/phosphomutase
MKTFLLGLDGMTLKTVEPYVRKNLLPNFKKLMAQGAYGVLHSTIPAITGPGWVSLATGKNPGKHGVYEFRKREGYEAKLITKNTSPYAEPIWSILSRSAKNVIINNMPFTYPPDEVNGIMISGLMTPGINTEFVFPRYLKKELLNLFPEYKLDVSTRKTIFSGNKDDLLRDVFKITEHGRKLMNYLLDNNPWDFFFSVFIGPDRIQHFLWDEILSMDPKCIEYYRLLDDTLGDVLRRINHDTALFIVSDHGFGALKKIFHINSYLRELGLLQVRENTITKNVLGKIDFSSVVSTAYKFLDRTGLLNLKEHLPRPLVNRIRHSLLVDGCGKNKIDWTKTKAFSLLWFGVNINIKEKEPNGVVEKADYSQLCERIKQNLLSVKDPETGKKVVKTVCKTEEIFTSEYAEGFPDLIVVLNDSYTIRNDLAPYIISDSRKLFLTGDHNSEGLFFAYGDIINNKRVDAEIYDIMPTLLYLMGTPIPEDVDGRILTEVLDKGFLERNQVRFEKPATSTPSGEKGLDQDQARKVEEQLRSLGYLG